MITPAVEYQTTEHRRTKYDINDSDYSINEFKMSFLSKSFLAFILVIIITLSLISIAAFYVLTALFNPNIGTFLPPPQVSVARNWAGYLVASDPQNPQPGFVAVNGSWTVPTVTDIGVDAFSDVWIGIGGQFDKTLIQVGTEQDFVNGQAFYSAWYEMLPQQSITIDSMQVNPGDRITASIITDNSSGQWLVSIQDLTNGQSFKNNFTYASSQLSAEWIVERPEVNNALSQLADFGSVTFTNCTATLNSTSGSVTNFANNPIVMDATTRNNQSVQLTSISSLNSQGTSFTVQYIA